MAKPNTIALNDDSQKATVADFLLMHFIVVLWGFTAILGALCSIGPLDLVWWRTGMAVLAMWLLFWKRLEWARASRKLKLSLLCNGGQCKLLPCWLGHRQLMDCTARANGG
jgi:hypothetical protein